MKLFKQCSSYDNGHYLIDGRYLASASLRSNKIYAIRVILDFVFNRTNKDTYYVKISTLTDSET